MEGEEDTLINAMNKHTWQILDAYFKNDPYFLTKHHLDSYNDFVYNKIPNIIKSLNPFITKKNDPITKALKHEIRIYVGGEEGDELFFTKPMLGEHLLLPNEARLKNITYKCDLISNIHVHYVEISNGKETTRKVVFEKIKLGIIPIMLHSNLCILHEQPDVVLKEMGECIYDRGGYFIIDGKEKVIVAQERMATNRLVITKSRDVECTFEGKIRCTIEEGAVFPKTVNIRVFSDKYLQGTRKNAIVMTIPNINREIPLFVLFRALGVESDKAILEHIVYDLNAQDSAKMMDFLFYSIRDGNFVYTQDQALAFLSKYVKYQDDIQYVRNLIVNDLFPNMNEKNENGTYVSLNKKAMFLGHISNHIVKICLGWEKESDRDNYIFKRVDISGFLTANLFRDFYNAFRNNARARVDSTYNYGSFIDKTDISDLITQTNRWKIFDSNIIENGMTSSLKGKWGVNQDPEKGGIVQDLSRISYIGFLSHLRRVDTPIDRGIKIVAPHRLHPTQWGMMCPCESPDGASIGLLKNFAILCHVSFDCSSREIIRCLKDRKVQMLDTISPRACSGDVVKVLVNNNWVGITKSPRELVYKLRLLRRNALINVMTSISWNIVGKEININTEAGRCCRPLYIVQNNSPIESDEPNKGNEHNRLRITLDDIQRINNKNMSWKDLIMGRTRKSFDFTDCTYYDPYDALRKSQPEQSKDKSKDGGVENEALWKAHVWKTLEKNASVIEFLDVEETNTAMIAMTFKDLDTPRRDFTHCEIHPSTIFAVLTANIPFSQHNQAPRNYFSGQQGKQSISVYSTAFNSRMDTMSMVLHYSQRAIVNTRYMHYLGNNALPHGTNTIVAIMCYTGFNQEDSIIINKGAIDKGLFHLTYYKTIVEDEEKDMYDTTRVIFENPVELSQKGIGVEGFGKRFARYTKIDASGMPKENSKISEGDVYIGKCTVTSEYEGGEGEGVGEGEEESIFKAHKKTEVYKDSSMIADKIMSGIVDKVHVFNNGEGMKTAKIRFRKTRTPVLGDKCGCYSDDTEILTHGGWKLFKQMTMEDKVATMVGNRLVYQKPTALQEYDFNGDLYKVSSNQVELLVTPNHRMYVRKTKTDAYYIEEARSAYRKIRHYKKDVDVWEPDITCDVPEEFVMEEGKVFAFRIPGFTDKFGKVHKDLNLAIKPWLIIFGIWMAEGCTLREDYVTFAANKPRVKNELTKCCEELGLEIRKHKNQKNDEERNAWIILSRPLVKYMLPFSVGAINKFLPEWVWSLPRDLCDDLIQGMLLGDGCFGTVKKGRYGTSSKLLANDFQRLCLHAGYSTNLCLHSEAGHQSFMKNGVAITANADAYRMSVITKQNEPIVNKYMYPPENNPNDSWQSYDGKVYCCTVPEGEGVLYVRRNGFSVWSGNSRMAQKGVVGLIMNPEDMPYTKDGIVPDLIINPHAIPTRMTIAHLLECVLSKLGCAEGNFYDGTPFCDHNIDKAYQRLEDNGFERYGNEVLYNGITGEQIPTDIFIGPTFYTRMKHMVEDKINSRAGGVDGNYIGLTRQPVKSRSKGGAGRIGEMEVGSILSHGIASFLKESMMERSDNYNFYIDDAGDIAIANKENNIYRSQTNEDCTNFSHVHMPYATKLLLHELETMSIMPRVICDDSELAKNANEEYGHEDDDKDDDEDANVQVHETKVPYNVYSDNEF